jgi:hypothetical protein
MVERVLDPATFTDSLKLKFAILNDTVTFSLELCEWNYFDKGCMRTVKIHLGNSTMRHNILLEYQLLGSLRSGKAAEPHLLGGMDL